MERLISKCLDCKFKVTLVVNTPDELEESRHLIEEASDCHEETTGHEMGEIKKMDSH